MILQCVYGKIRSRNFFSCPCSCHLCCLWIFLETSQLESEASRSFSGNTGALLTCWHGVGFGKHSKVLWLGLSLSLNLSWGFPFSKLARPLVNDSGSVSSNMVSLKCRSCRGEWRTPGGHQNAYFPPPLQGAGKDPLTPILTVGTWDGSWKKNSQNCKEPNP